MIKKMIKKIVGNNKVDNINLKFEVYECVRGGM